MEIARHWRLKKQRYSLTGEVCSNCDTRIFPPRDICPDCGKEAKQIFNFSGKGEIYSYSTVYNAPAGYEESAPYTVAMIRLEEGPLLTAQLTDFEEEDLQIGAPVEMVTRKLRQEGDERSMLVYGYKFRPVMKNRLN
jgi:uncharacterized OB-fold protein